MLFIRVSQIRLDLKDKYTESVQCFIYKCMVPCSCNLVSFFANSFSILLRDFNELRIVIKVSFFVCNLNQLTQNCDKRKMFVLKKKGKSPNLMNLSRGLNLPKTGFNRAPAEILKNLIQFLVEIAIFEPRLKFFQFGLKIK